MGREARCHVTMREGSGAEHAGEGRVHLDDDALQVSGGARSPLRARVPRSEIREIVARDGVVDVAWSGGLIALALGSAADAWARALRTAPKPVIDKLGVKESMVVSIRGDVGADLRAQIEARAARVRDGAFAPRSDVVLLVAHTARDLDAIPAAAAALAPGGALWVLHPRGVREVADTVVFAAGREAGLVATKVARIDDALTGEKLVRPRGV